MVSARSLARGIFSSLPIPLPTDTIKFAVDKSKSSPDSLNGSSDCVLIIDESKDISQSLI